MKRLWIIPVVLLSLGAAAAVAQTGAPKTQQAQPPIEARFTYINNDGEYSMRLPDAPTGVTIWADDRPIPYLTKPPAIGIVGENATYRYVDIETGHMFDTRILFLNADKDFTRKLTEAHIKSMMEREYAHMRLDKPKFVFKQEPDGRKVGLLTGYTVDRSNSLLFNSMHFLVGKETVQTVKIQYNLENKRLNDLYMKVRDSITYVGK